VPYLDPLHPLPSCILESLSSHKDISIEELHDNLKRDFAIKCSRQNLYRTVSLLIENQVLVRAHGKLSLNLVWVSHLVELGDTLKHNYQRVEENNFWGTLKEGQSREFHADSLINLDPVWNDGLLQLVQLSTLKEWYVYNSHPWYSLGMLETEVRLYKSIVASGINCHMLYGNNSFLDIYGQKKRKVEGFHTAIAKVSQFHEEGHALWACDDFVVECVMPPVISKHFAFFFQNVKAIEDFDPQLFSDVFRMKARCKIKFSRKAKEAERYRRILSKYF